MKPFMNTDYVISRRASHLPAFLGPPVQASVLRKHMAVSSNEAALKGN